MDIAIIGMSCKFPEAESYSEFWDNLIQKKSSITEIPSARWDWKKYWGDPVKEAMKSFSKWGGFVKDVDAFDASFFGLLPQAAQAMDPQQRIMLELSWACLEDAGIAPSTLRGKKVGVIYGVFNHDYKELHEVGESPIGAHYSTGTAASVIANRVSHFFDLRGPSFPVDTACSSSLNAIHSAIQAIQFGDCEMALAGGVSLLITPTRHFAFSKMGMLSPTGSCKTFDSNADGYVRGEGAGVVLLKPLEKAVADGDTIYGVVKGTAVNHCGETYTLTYPSPRAQADVIIAAHERANVPVDTVNYVEAHGTGTPKGDPIEFEGLLNAYSTLIEKQQLATTSGFCALGSVKTNIGHLEAAAGIAGVIKVLMALRHQQLPALQNYSSLNPRINITDTPFSLLHENKTWLPVVTAQGSIPLRAGISSFGFGGTNSHVILEQAPVRTRKEQIQKPAYLIALSAKIPAVLHQIKSNLLDWLRNAEQEPSIEDLSAGLLVGRDHFSIRCCYLVKNIAELTQVLADSVEQDKNDYAAVDNDALDLLSRVTESASHKIASLKSDIDKNSFESYVESLYALADFYLQGAKISWSLLFNSKEITRLSLPTYPFMKDRFWLAPAKIAEFEKPAAEPELEAKGNSYLHPLLHQNTSNLEQQRYTSFFSGDEFFLKDHSVKNHAVLPAVAYLELAREAVKRSMDFALDDSTSYVTEFRGVVWLRPFIAEQQSNELRIKINASLDANTSTASLSKPVEFEMVSGFEHSTLVTNCQGRVSIAPLDGLPQVQFTGDISTTDWQQYNAEECYSRFSAVGFGYGAAQQSISSLAINSNELLVKLDLPESLQPSSHQYALHPSIADGALQAAVALASGNEWKNALENADDSPSPYLPFTLKNARLYTQTQKTQWAWVRFSKNNKNTTNTAEVDIDIFSGDLKTNTSLQMIAQIQGLGMRKLTTENPTTTKSNIVSAAPITAEKLIETFPGYYTPQWLQKPIENVSSDALTSLLVLGTPLDVEGCVGRLRGTPTLANIQLIQVTFGNNYQQKDSLTYVVRAGNEEDFQKLVADISTHTKVPEQVLFVCEPLSELQQTHDHLVSKCLSHGAESAFALVKAYLKPVKRARFISLVLGEKDQFVPIYQGLSGFYKTIKIERPAYSGRVVVSNYSKLANNEFASLILKEFTDSATDTDIAYANNVRYSREFLTLDDSVKLNQLTQQQLQQGFKTGGVYLVTGGLGALGLLVATHLVKQYKARVYLTGRSPLTAENSAKLKALTVDGGHIEYIAGDISDRDAVEAMVKSINDQGHLINGVIHSAGVIEDNFIIRKNGDAFKRVITPKSKGTVNLDVATQHQPLDLFVLFSSVTGILGNMGQCDYAFGNSFEDYFSHYRNNLAEQGKRSGKSVSINWPYWKEGGMVLTEKEEAVLRKSFGIIPLENANGLAALEFAVKAPIAQIAVLEGDAVKVKEVLAVKTLTDIEFEATSRKADSETVSAVVEEKQLVTTDKTHSTSVKDEAVNYLIRLFAAEADIPEERFELHAQFQQYGFDSVVVVGLVLALEEDFEDLPKTLFFEYQSINDLADYFVENHGQFFNALATKSSSVKVEEKVDAPVSSSSAAAKDEAVKYLIRLFAAEAGIGEERFELHAPFQQYGFDSVVVVGLVIALENDFEDLPKTLFFEYQNISDLADYFVENHAQFFNALATKNKPVVQSAASSSVTTETVVAQAIASTRTPVQESASRIVNRTTAQNVNPSLNRVNADDEIAIIGVSGRFPEADDLVEYWDNLKNGVDCIKEIPAEREWDMENFYQSGSAVLGKTYSKWGGFLKSVDQFDPLFFGISPMEAEKMDPHERLFLETVALAIEDAGYRPERLAKPQGVRDNPVGVFTGVMWSDYQLYGVDGQTPSDVSAPRSWYWAAANRVSYQFNFSGPSITIDTACSSSLTAIHLACDAIKRGEIQVAVAGGVNLSLHPQKYNLLSDSHFLASDGRCRSFGVGGDGYVPAEAVGAVILKSKSDAIRDGDHIYGIIKSTSINHGGKTSGFTVPNPNRQSALIKDAIEVAGINPRHVSYVEAHGTGTSLGDPIEISGLTKAFNQTEHQYCAIGSAKSNVGHAEAAAGIVGLTKILLQLKHKMLAPSLHSSELNPYAKIDQSPFYVLQALEDWKRPRIVDAKSGVTQEIPRIAALSSFGAGGSNGHLIIEEYPQEIDPRSNRNIKQVDALILLSAKKEQSLRAMAEQLLQFLVREPSTVLYDLAYTLQVGRVSMEHGLAIIASDLGDLQQKLKTYLLSQDSSYLAKGIYSGKRSRAKRVDADTAKTIDSWLAQGNLHNLADAWISGQDVDWNNLQQTNEVFRISAPGYAYSRQRYWVAKPKKGSVAKALSSFIDTNTSTLGQQQFSKTFSKEAFYLRDHILGVNRVLPGVAYLELANQAAQLSSNHEKVLGLTDIKWLKPIVVNDKPELIKVNLNASLQGVEFEIFKQHENTDNRTVYATGTLALQKYSSVASLARFKSQSNAINTAIVKARSQQLTPAQVNAQFESLGFTFGSSFQVFKSFYFTQSEALAELKLAPEIAAEASEFTLHPALLDGALRTSLGIGGFNVSRTGLPLPVALDRIQIHKPLTEDCLCYAVYSDVQPTKPMQESYDILVMNYHGEVLVSLHGFVTQRVTHLADAKKVATEEPRAAINSPKNSVPQSAVVATPVAIAAIVNNKAAPVVDSKSAVRNYLVGLVSNVTKVPQEDIDSAASLENYGIDSVMIMSMNEKLEATFGDDVPKTLFFEYQDIESITEYFAENYSDKARALASETAAVSEQVIAAPVTNVHEFVTQPVAQEANPVNLLSAANKYVAKLLSDVTKLAEDQIEFDMALENYGIDSVMIMSMNEKLESQFGSDIPKTLFFEYQTVAEIGEFLLENYEPKIQVMFSSSKSYASQPSANAVVQPEHRAAASTANENAFINNLSVMSANKEHLPEPSQKLIPEIENLARVIGALSDDEVERLLREMTESNEFTMEY